MNLRRPTLEVQSWKSDLSYISSVDEMVFPFSIGPGVKRSRDTVLGLSLDALLFFSFTNQSCFADPIDSTSITETWEEVNLQCGKLHACYPEK